MQKSHQYILSFLDRYTTKMSLLQENVYFYHRKVNKNAYFTLFKVNKNVNLVIFNISKIACFVAFATCYFSTQQVGQFWGNWQLAIGLNCSSVAIPASNLSPLTFNLSTRLSSDEQRPPTLRRQQTTTSPMDHRQGIGRIDHLCRLLHHPDCGGWWGRFACRCYRPVHCYTQDGCHQARTTQMVDTLWIGRRCSRPAHLAPNKRTAAQRCTLWGRTRHNDRLWLWNKLVRREA